MHETENLCLCHCLSFTPTIVAMSDTFRKSLLNRLPPMPPTRAPWAGSSGSDEEDEDEKQEQLEGGDTMSELGQRYV